MATTIMMTEEDDDENYERLGDNDDNDADTKYFHAH